MRSFAIVFVLFLLSFFQACTQQDLLDASDVPVNVQLDAAFTVLDYVDVYSQEGEFQKTIDSSMDFQDVLSVGSYYMDFVNEDGASSFMDDGRLAFAPMGEGMTPMDGPFEIDGQNMWEVAVDSVLEANARLNIRIRDGDETLRPWKERFQDWQMNLPQEERDPIHDSEWIASEKAYSTSYGSSTTRLRVTWEASFAMTGYFTSSSTSTVTCRNSTSCWNRRGNGYAYWDYDSNGTGYIDYDTSAWSTLRSNYTNLVSCVDGGFTPCSISVGSSTPKYYTCQSSSGSCISGSGSSATKPRGGQCKAFANLLLYRSGQYNSGSWRTLPSQSTIYCSTSSYPILTTSTIAVGDVLQRVDGVSGSCSDTARMSISTVHTQLVVAYDSSARTAIVVDSNYSGNNGNEYIGYHTAGFSTTSYSDYSLLSNYRDLDCVYTGGC